VDTDVFKGYVIGVRGLLNAVNSLFVRLQRWKQGIPAGSAHIYNLLATRLLEREYEYVIEEIRKAGQRLRILVEVGCGTGKLLVKVAESIDAAVAVGLDISCAMARIAKSNIAKSGVYAKINVVVGDAHRLPFREKSVDFIVSTGTLHHLRTPEVFFRECSSVLAPGGEAWIYELSHDAESEDFKKMAEVLRKPRFLVKLVLAMHGLPRREYESGILRKRLYLLVRVTS